MKPKLAVVLILIAAAVTLAARLPDDRKNQNQPYLNEALSAARWIESTSVTTSSGVVWPDDPTDSQILLTLPSTQARPGPSCFFWSFIAIREKRNFFSKRSPVPMLSPLRLPKVSQQDSTKASLAMASLSVKPI